MRPPWMGKCFLRLRIETVASAAVPALRHAARSPIADGWAPVAGAVVGWSDGVGSIVTVLRLRYGWVGSSADDVANGSSGSAVVLGTALAFLWGVQPAASATVLAADPDEARLILAALPGIRATRLELAARRHAERVRHDALDRMKRSAPLGLGRDRVHEALGVRVLGTQKDLFD